MTNEIGNIASWVWDKFGIAGLVAFIAVLSILFSYMVIRAGSAHFIFDRLWSVLGGNKEFFDKRLNDQWNEVRDVEMYRYRSQLKIYSLDQIIELKKWMSDKKISLLELMSVSSLFSVRDKKFFHVDFVSKNRWLNIRVAVSTFALLASYILLVQPYTYLSVKKTGTTFFAKSNELRIYGKFIDKEYCESLSDGKISENSKEIKEDTEVACSIFSEDGRDFLKKSLKEQQFLFALFMIVAFVAILFGIRRTIFLARVKEIYEREEIKNEVEEPTLKKIKQCKCKCCHCSEQ